MEAAGTSGAVNAQQARQVSQVQRSQSELIQSPQQGDQSTGSNEQQRRAAFKSAGLGQNVDQLA